jgi:hypothetical protein
VARSASVATSAAPKDVPSGCVPESVMALAVGLPDQALKLTRTFTRYAGDQGPTLGGQ